LDEKILNVWQPDLRSWMAAYFPLSANLKWGIVGLPVTVLAKEPNRLIVLQVQGTDASGISHSCFSDD
jgi:hypothetical protein